MEDYELMGAVKRCLGARIRLMRRQMNMSQTRFGVMVGLGRSSISAIERGLRSVTIENLVRISAGLDMTLSELFDGVDESIQDHRQYMPQMSYWALERASSEAEVRG